MKRRKQKDGFTLLEMLVYIGLTFIVLSLTVSFMISLIRSYTRFRVERDVSTNAREAMNYMLREIKSADDVYIPTSVLGPNPGQLSLETSISPPPDETTAFIDFYVDNGQLLLKREEQDPFPLTSDRVQVDNLIFTHFTNPSGSGELLQIEITVGYRSNASRFEFNATQEFTSSAALRGQY